MEPRCVIGCKFPSARVFHHPTPLVIAFDINFN